MTVSYQYDVACSTSGGFTRLLFKWKGSVYKLVYRELIWFSIAYATVSIVYRCVLADSQKRFFEGLVSYCDTFINMIPLPFVLGFYVSFVATRWWQQYMAIPWPDKILHCIALYVSGTDDHARVIRRTLMRYLNLSLILVLRSISMAVRKRFPTLQHVVEGGFMTKAELDLYQAVPSVEFNTYWIPCTWFISLLRDARRTNMINDNQGLKLIMEEFNEYRARCGLLWSYDWVSIPLVYTQVVTLATYSFFIACIVGRQYVDHGDPSMAKTKVDLYVPIFTLLQFFFYMGLLKVAEALINPFGDDDEDFELNWIIDRHTKVSYLVVDTLMNSNPPVVKDAFFDESEVVLAYTKASMTYKKKTYRGSVAYVTVPEDQQTLVLPDIPEEEENPTQEGLDPTARRSASSFMNLLNPDKSWSAGGNKQRSRTKPGNLESAGRLSTTSLPDEALSSIARSARHHSPHIQEPQTAPAGSQRRMFPFHSAGTRGAPLQGRTGSSESLAASEVSGDSAGDGSPVTNGIADHRLRDHYLETRPSQPSPQLPAHSSPRRSSHPVVASVSRTTSNGSGKSDPGGGSGGGLMRSKWKMVRKKFLAKSQSADVESPAELIRHRPLDEKSHSTPDVKVEHEVPGRGNIVDNDDEDFSSAVDVHLAGLAPEEAGNTQPTPAKSTSTHSGKKSSPVPKVRKKRSGRHRRTSSGSGEMQEKGSDSGVPSPGTSMSDIHHDYMHTFYDTYETPKQPPKRPDPPGTRTRTSSLTPELFLTDDSIGRSADNGEQPQQPAGGAGSKPAMLARSMPDLRSSQRGSNGGGGAGESPRAISDAGSVEAVEFQTRTPDGMGSRADSFSRTESEQALYSDGSGGGDGRNSPTPEPTTHSMTLLPSDTGRPRQLSRLNQTGSQGSIHV